MDPDKNDTRHELTTRDPFQRLFMSVVYAMAFLLVLGMLANIPRAAKSDMDLFSFLQWSFFLVFFGLLLLQKKIPFRVFVWLFVFMIWIIGAVGLLKWGILGNAEIILGGIILTVAISQKGKSFLILMTLTLLLYFAVGSLFMKGILQPVADPGGYTISLEGWVVSGLIFFVFIGILADRTGWMIREIAAKNTGIETRNEKLFEEIKLRKEMQESLEKMIHRKESLLREVHHRVKSNLQIISSVINVRAMTISDSDVRRITRTTEGQILSMAAIHEILYRSENLSKLNLKNLVETLCLNIEAAYGLRERNIRLGIFLETVEVGMEKAVPFALVVNEVVNNSVIHAFPEPSEGGEIQVILSVSEKNEIRAEIRDNGKGIRSRLKGRNPSGMGYNLINIITEEMGARYEVAEDNGTVFRFSFPV